MDIELYSFEYFDKVRKRWMRARWKAKREDIERVFPEFRLMGEPEVRHVEDDLAKRFPTAPGL